MENFLQFFVSSDDFMPHGHCFLWTPWILWTSLIADIVIVTAYFSIPFILLVIIRNRKNIPYKWLLAMFSAFIFLCGISHIFGAITIWKPLYAYEAVVKALTAIISLITAILIAPILPKLLAQIDHLMNAKEEASAAEAKLDEYISAQNNHKDNLHKMLESELPKITDASGKIDISRLAEIISNSHQQNGEKN